VPAPDARVPTAILVVAAAIALLAGDLGGEVALIGLSLVLSLAAAAVHFSGRGRRSPPSRRSRSSSRQGRASRRI
jgi:hypothetical protein